ncbi:hypothetical protein I6A60_27335 [Frankia sp. AgB1.9]|uniref:hypothetical protein n=1 Tax=unclassified Frankia TaxID=2632575 RepID=UPI00193467E7|nr:MULTISPECIES: hypothetical protein [unclassified Frankia]MBL7494500.1 hypothetical protein [Frankia sp. AgW1.1]MBL7551542.1 hypothetical protein [Frankia sp. AgB1.9]MBL7622277.1 hypothetical protein [Frankia sp. AgB1.8]
MRRHLSSAVPASLVMTMLAACGFLLTSCHSPYLPPGVGGGHHTPSPTATPTQTAAPTGTPTPTATPTAVRKPTHLEILFEPSLDPKPPAWFVVATATDHTGQLPGEPHPTGTVTVTVNGVLYGTVDVGPINSDDYGVEVRVLPGRTTFVVDYNGDVNYLPSHQVFGPLTMGT